VQRARLAGRADIDVLLLGKPEYFERLVEGARAASARILVTFNELAYLRVRIDPRKALELRELAGLEAFAIDHAVQTEIDLRGVEVNLQLPGSGQRVLEVDPRPEVDLTTLDADGPAFGASFMGVPEFTRAHPTFDGRGTGVAVVEDVIDFQHPAFRFALAVGGEPVRKIRAIVDTGLERPDRNGGGVAGDRDVVVVNGIFDIDESTFRAPHNGTFRFGRRYMSHGLYLPRNSQFAVLWDGHRGLAWVDVNRDGDFSRVEPLRDFNEHGDVGHVPAPPGFVAESNAEPGASGCREAGPMPFALCFDVEGTPILYSGDTSHATAVAGASAGEGLCAGVGSSAAPKAAIVLVAVGQNGSDQRAHDWLDWRAHHWLEGIALAARRPDVDLITSSTLCEPMDRDSGNFVALVLERIVGTSGKQILWAATNYPGLTCATSAASAARNVLSIGGYANAETEAFLHGIADPRRDRILYAYGPSPDGRIKPDVLGTSIAVTSTSPAHDPWHSAPRQFQLPAGSFVFAGTSSATPHTASVALALTSGAKQSGIRIDAVRIRWTLRAGARYLADWPAHAQGTGLVDAVRSWELLEKTAAWPDWRFDPEIEVRAPARSPKYRSHVGNGLYESEGWSAGDHGERTLALTRRAGPKEEVRYRLRWIGNDGTFSLRGATTIGLVQHQPLALTIDVSPTSAGAHSAHLAIDDIETGYLIDTVGCIVIANDPVDENNAYDCRFDRNRATLDVAHLFVDIPAGTSVLRVDACSMRGEGHIIMKPPLEVGPILSANAVAGVAWPQAMEAGTGTHTRLYRFPQHGGWEISMRPTSDAYAAIAEPQDFALRVRSLAAHVEIALTGGRGGEFTADIAIENRFAALESAVLRAAIGWRRKARVPNREPYAVEVAPSANSLSVDAAVRTCTYRLVGAEPKLWSPPYMAPWKTFVRDPEPGTWLLVPTDEEESAGPHDLEIVVTDPMLGETTIRQQASPRAHRERWTAEVRGHFDIGMIPPGAEPVVAIEVIDQAAEDAECASAGFAVAQRPFAVGRGVARL
jgi:subtilisin family serine protease